MAMQVERNDRVLLYALATGELYAIADVYLVQSRQFQTRGHGTFLLSTGAMVGGGRLKAVKPTLTELVAAETAIADRLNAKIAAEDAAKQAAYDTLPEEVKLARKLQFFCSASNADKTISRMPIEVLRAAVAWIEENKLECE